VPTGYLLQPGLSRYLRVMIQAHPSSRLFVFLSASLALGAALACDDAKSTSAKAAATVAAAPTPEKTVPTASPGPTASTSATPPAPNAPAATYDIDVSHSRLTFSVRHMMISNTRGQFGKFSGTAFIDEANPSASNVNLDIDTASIDSSDPKRDEHLRGADFFDVKKFPKMVFRSKQIARVGAGWKVSGDLTIRAVTKPVVLEVEAISPSIKDPWGGTRRGTRARATLNRKDFELTWNKALEAGGVAVGDEVTLDLEVELVEKKAK
jgi:polyisoprenoid-binding protein YceI